MINYIISSLRWLHKGVAASVLKRSKVTFPAIVTLAIFTTIFSSCISDSDKNIPEDTIVKLGSKTLTLSEVRDNLPGGLMIDDSVKYAHSYIASWIDSHLISEIAADEINLDEINRLTEDYRNELIMNHYRRHVAATGDIDILSEDSLHSYYEQHINEFKLQRPMVRGVYLKVPEDAQNLSILRRLYHSEKQADIDRLEKEVLKSAIHYDYFHDRWVDWEQIEKRIPYDFNTSTLAAKKKFDISSGGFVYLLDISDYLPIGAKMPFDAASGTIRDRLMTKERQHIDRKLRKNIYDKAVEDGMLEFIGISEIK